MAAPDFSFTQYVPFLKAKAGEADALSRVPAALRAAMTPLFDVPRPPRYADISLDDQLQKAARQIIRAMGTSRSLFLDLFDIPLAARCALEDHPMTRTLALLTNASRDPIPVYGFDRDDPYLDAVMDHRKLAEVGMCLRLLDDDISNADNLAETARYFCDHTGVAPEKIDVVIDHRSIIGHSPATLKAESIDAIQAISDEGRFRRVILSGSHFPKDVTPVPKDSIGFIPRTEYDVWRHVSSVLRRRSFVGFGDYCVVHPDFVELGPVPHANAKIRYTIGNHWMIARGHALAEHPGYSQYYNLAGHINSNANFCGSTFSYGDGYISECAAHKKGPGNLRTWIGVDANHHLHFATAQVVRHVRTERLPLEMTA